METPPHVGPDDALALAALAARSLDRRALLLAQADAVRWALSLVDARCVERARLTPGPYDGLVDAIERLRRGERWDVGAASTFVVWMNGLTTDWATREALLEIAVAAQQTLCRDPVSPSSIEVDLEGSVHGLLRGAGLIRWDELLAEEHAACGVRGEEQEAQEERRDRDVAEAAGALCAILREHLFAAGVPEQESTTGAR